MNDISFGRHHETPAKEPNSNAAAQDALDLTEQLFEIAVEDLTEALSAVRAGRFDTLKEGKAAVKALADLSKQVLEERKNVDKLRKQISGACVGAGELDLGAARIEIGRRLACLRTARGD